MSAEEPEGAAKPERSITSRLHVDEVEATLGTLEEERDVALSTENARGVYRVALRRWSNGSTYTLVQRAARKDGQLAPTKGGKALAVHLDELRAVAAALIAAADALAAEGYPDAEAKP